MDEPMQPKLDDKSAAQEALALLRRQALLFAKLESVAVKQGDLISRDDATPLLALLADRQRLAMDLSQIGRRLESARRNWVATRNASCSERPPDWTDHNSQWYPRPWSCP